MRRVAACVVLATVPALTPAQSLGEAARQEQARRRRIEAAGEKARVITDSELSPRRADEPEDAGAAARTPAGAESASGAAEAGRQHAHAAGEPSDDNDRLAQEDLWRQRMQEARNRVDGARRRHDYLSTLIMVPGKYYVDENHRAVITSTEQLQQLTAEAEADLKSAEQALADLEERARRAGVPPGWLR